jgi:toxin ParE1/3/4
MKSLRRSDDFNADVRREWTYLSDFGEPLADRFINHVEETLRLLAQQPAIGHPGRYRHPGLRGLRMHTVIKPFRAWLIFYWDRPESVDLFRLIHGARDLPRVLVESIDPA